MDLAPMQVVSVSTALIPFLEHDDANRALMGSNMQRQAVPLMVEQAPYVGTGMEGRAAYDSRICIVAKKPGIVLKVDSKAVIVKEEGTKDPVVYPLIKYKKTNQGTCFNQRPIVSVLMAEQDGKVIKITKEKLEVQYGEEIF